MLATIDVGSLTVRLLLGEVVDGQVVPHLYRRAVTRLGTGLNQNRGLLPAPRERTLDALMRFSAEMGARRVAAVAAYGTEALRRAGEVDGFLAEVVQKCGLAIEVVDGDREALLTSRGVLAALEPRPSRCLVIDVGGGSTELVVLLDGRPLWRTSLPLGVVRIATLPETERGACIVEQLARARSCLVSAGLLDLVLADDCSLGGPPAR